MQGDPNRVGLSAAEVAELQCVGVLPIPGTDQVFGRVCVVPNALCCQHFAAYLPAPIASARFGAAAVLDGSVALHAIRGIRVRWRERPGSTRRIGSRSTGIAARQRTADKGWVRRCIGAMQGV